MNKKLTKTAAGMLFLLLIAGWVYACWELIPLEQRIKNADYVIVGKIIEVRPAFSIAFESDLKGWPTGSMGYSAGRLIVTDVLQGDRWRPEFKVFFQSEPGVSTTFTVAEGDSGIWLLDRSELVYALWISRPDNFLPVDSLELVERHAVLKRGRLD